MRFVHLMEATVKPGQMQTFVNAVQQWERSAFEDEHAPEYHAVYVSEREPGKVVMITQFRDEQHAAAFGEHGLLDAFRASIGDCCVDPPRREGYDLFYGAGPGGTRAIFGEEPRV